MTTYEVIDAVCDSVNPILFLSSIGVIGYFLIKKNYKHSLFVGLGTLYGLLVTYGILFIDKKVQFWERMGMDYSTHTAFAFALCSVIGIFMEKAVLMAVILAAYIIAMLYQRYHTVADIASTLLVLSALVLPLLLLLKRKSGKGEGLHINLVE
jgi:hypothetical protein